MVHGDDKGLIMPPKVAPTQVVIVPIPYKGAEPAAIAAKAREIAEMLKAKGVSFVLDDREEYTPGWKFNQWELKGVPIRIEIGPRDLKQQQVVMVRRDTCQKTAVKEIDIPATVEKLCKKFRIICLLKPKLFCKKKPVPSKAMRNSKKSYVTKAALSRQHGAATLTVKQKLKMKQVQPSELDLSRKKN